MTTTPKYRLPTPRYTYSGPNLWWCELTLPTENYFRSWVCCPGTTQGKALDAALRQASRYAREARVA